MNILKSFFFFFFFYNFFQRQEENISIHNSGLQLPYYKTFSSFEIFAFIDYYFKPFYASNFSILDNTFTQFEVQLLTIKVNF